MIGLLSTVSYWYIRAANVGVSMLDSEVGKLAGGSTAKPPPDMAEVFVWGPTTHVEFWAAIVGGMLTFAHYFLLLKAFEGASSTVLLPLVQVASVATLLGSASIALFRHESWITARHLAAYVLLFVGGAARPFSPGTATPLSPDAHAALVAPASDSRAAQACCPRVTASCARSSARASGGSRSSGARSSPSSRSARTT